MTLCNIVLFILAFIFLGGSFGVKSAYAAFGLSITMSIIEKFTTPVPITDNLVLATIFGSVINLRDHAVDGLTKRRNCI